MDLSEEQEIILDASKRIFESSTDGMIQISARSGSGKTFMLSTIATTLKPNNGMYLAYNRVIAKESKHKFKDTIICRTTHSLAYMNIVKNLGLKLGSFNYKNIKERIEFEEKLIVVDIIEKFCLSDSTDIHKLFNDKFNKKLIDIAQIYMRKMQSKEIDCTHSFYLKLYQLSLKAGIIKPKKLDLLMLDEAGDINEVTLSIFKLLPAKLKILVGDNHQNIYSFNGTINGFEALKGIGEYYEMTKSFRVSSSIAKGIEEFCIQYLDTRVKFIGMDYRDNEMEINSHAYISRTNANMIGRMVILDEHHIKYNLVRPVKSIFELILILIYLRPNGKIFNTKFEYLQTEANEWNNDELLKRSYPNLFSYIAYLNEGDIEIGSAMSLISKFGKYTLMSTYESATKHEKSTNKHLVTLTTAHS